MTDLTLGVRRADVKNASVKDKIFETIFGEIAEYIIPVSQTLLINELRKAGCIQEEQWLDDGVHISARVSGRLLALASPFVQ